MNLNALMLSSALNSLKEPHKILRSLLPNNAPVTLPIKFDTEKVLQLPEMKFE